MIPIACLAVVASTVWWLEWTDAFHMAVGFPIAALATLVARAVAVRRRTMQLNDAEAIVDENGSPPLARLAWGLAAGAALAALLQIAFMAAARTPLYPALVDTATTQLIAELDVLEAHGQWQAIADRLAALPPTQSRTAQVQLADRRVGALIHLAEMTRDTPAACDLYRMADRVTLDQNLDRRLVRAKLEWCDARSTRRPLPANVRAEIARVERIGPDALQVEVNVADENGRPLAGLSADDFALTAGPQALRITTVSARSIASGTGQRVSIVLDQSIPAWHEALVSAAYFATGLASGDSVEVIACGASTNVAVARTEDLRLALKGILMLRAAPSCALADAISLALGRMGAGPRRSIVLIADASQGTASRTTTRLVQEVRAHAVPVFAVGLPREDLQELAGASGGAVIDPASRSARESLRSRLRSLPSLRPLTYLLICAGTTSPDAQLELQIGGANAVRVRARL